ncbi:MAG: hypothetical protein GTN62_00005, partial [Gemmatimonadales bacterium]|nr:hypothetical protein [Gemmatimonadales bacterium]NIN09781.1 hypothetical protein [Gemmatimonadales bacterium]NIN48492.1 hypothetical protein [Gemmatimonadales bacterium]NIP05956.1 hypothetical protein [Gemmatimonadales bacterium]NIQ99899.1 hypothetical protein [Gemmatimonadales bacterium]
PADVVIAEDPLQQRWYAGSVDVWLRSYHDARQYLYTTDGAFRDIYVSSIFAGSRSMLDSLVGAATGRAWLITSGETYPARAYFLERDQRAWLDSIEHSIPPAFVARDGVTTVYCLNCASAAHEPHAGPKSPMR